MKMPKKVSAGLLMYKFNNDKLKVFLVHPGGPFWRGKEENAWSIPKGEVDAKDNGNLLGTAKREFFEETGIKPPRENEKYLELGSVDLAHKKVYAWAFEGDWSGLLMCQTFVEMIIPQTGKKIKFQEIDKAGFFSAEETKKKINKNQFELIERLEKRL